MKKQKTNPSKTISLKQGSKLPDGYASFLEEIKTRIQQSQIKAALAVNKELVLLYWEVGRQIVERQDKEGWGKSIVDHLALDIVKAFPDMKGFSSSNIWRMRSFYLAWPNPILAQPARELKSSKKLAQAARVLGNPQPPEEVLNIPWWHNVILIEKLKEPALRLWYAKQAVAYGWSRNVLELQIKSQLHKRQGKAISNFEKTLPSPQSDLAQEIIKDPYNFDFLNLSAEAREHEIEKELAYHIQKFLLELGVGFAFVGRQYHLEVSGQDFYIDLLFYHLKLRCYVVIELKAGDFKPEYAGKLNFYLSAIDAELKHPSDAPSIGLILCKGKNKFIVEYALRDMKKPIGVSEYQITRSIPSKLRSSLPTVAELEKELSDKSTE